MSTVTLTLGGRPYRVACEPGQEARLQTLGALVDGKLAALPQPGDPRSLVFAALMLADEVDEAHAAIAALEETADRLEKLADMLEKGGDHA